MLLGKTERFSNDCRKTNTKVIEPITAGANSAMNQSEFIAITCNLLKAREKSHAQDTIGFGFASNWLKKRREILKPVTKCYNLNRVITSHSHLEIACVSPRLINFFQVSIAGCLLLLGFVSGSRINHHPRLRFRFENQSSSAVV